MPSVRDVVFRRYPVEFRVDGLRVQLIPSEHTAAEWMSALTGPDVRAEVVRLLGPGADQILDAVDNGKFHPSRVRRLYLTIITEVTGRPWWEAMRLASSVVGGDGRVLGNLCLMGVRPEQMTIAEYLCAVWAFLTRHADQNDLLKLESQLKAPPPDAEDEDYDLMEEDDFGETVRQLQNAPGVSLG